MSKLAICFSTLFSLLIPLAFLLSGCSDKPPLEPKVTEILPKKDKGVASLDTPEAQLFADASQYYSDRLYTIARDNFESLQTAYPLSPYAEFAELKISDCDFELRDFDKAAIGYEEFLKNHPISESAPYATLMAGRSFQLSSNGPGRDSASLRKSLDYFAKVTDQYSDSAYGATAKSYSQEARRDLAQHEQLILNFYKKKGNDKAYEARKTEFDQKWRDILAEPDNAETKLVSMASLDQMPVIDPSKILTAGSTHPQGAIHSAAARSESSTSTGSTLDPDMSLKAAIARVECKQDSGKEIMVYLNSPLPQNNALADGSSFTAATGAVQITLPFKGIKPFSADCFGNKDVTVSRDGLLAIAAVKSVQLMTLSNPDRLLFVAN